MLAPGRRAAGRRILDLWVRLNTCVNVCIFGLRSLHRAFAECDTGNRARIIEQFPFIAQAAKFYGMHSEACNTFEHDDIVMPNDAIKEILDNL